MEIKKELPEVFNDFGEMRKKSFLAAYEMKQKNIPFVGTFCTYFPQELAMAMGACVVGLCSTSDETIPEAEKDLPRNLCPLIKSSYGFAKTDKCPYFYFSDLMVGETTCDGKKKMYEYLGQFKPVYTMELPNSQSPEGLELWTKEIIKLKEKLESHFETTITDEAVREQVKIMNEVRRAMKEFYALTKVEPVPILGQNLFSVLYGSSFRFNKVKLPDEIRAVVAKVKAEYAENPNKYPKAPRILVTGCPIGGGASKCVKAIEDNGGHVVVFENCSGAKSFDKLVDEDAPDIYRAIAERYLSIGCSVMTPNPNRLELLGRMIDEYRVDAVVEITLQACHTYNVETLGIKRFVNEVKGIPYMAVETDYSTADLGQLNTRMAAFLEML